MFGIKEPTADAEVIALAVNYLKSIGLNDLDVEINSLGCPKCREEFSKNLRDALRPHLHEMCPDCQARFEKNPLRILDCKVPECKAILESEELQNVIAKDYICDECHEHFEKVKSYLDILNIKYTVNKLLVRGLDYYNRTVFEIKSNNLGSQNAVCGGGRYDSLVGHLGGQDTPAVGFAMGMERLKSLLPEKESQILTAYVVSNDVENTLKFVNYLRSNGISADFDMTNKKFTKQLEKASKTAKFACILGEDEIKNNQVSIKNLQTSNQVTVKREEVLSLLK